MAKFIRVYCCRRCANIVYGDDALDTKDGHPFFSTKGILHRCEAPNKYGFYQQTGYDIIEDTK
jgi:hypothetical protein